ncbi:nucleoside 2-deoxyribosyltransferase [Candidatus Bathyarchaeota archaeon]|nr:nucleoside 2-deoxyribosyltransferase [Candidatus Bathyarchaeota archaeon]
MEIYFAGSIRGEQPDKEWFQRLIDHISGHGRVLTEHSFGFTDDEEAEIDDKWIFETDMGWLRDADALVAEVTAPSLGVGYEIAKAETWGKPALLLYRETPGRDPSAMLHGNKGLTMVRFTDEDEALEAVSRFLDSIKD